MKTLLFFLFIAQTVIPQISNRNEYENFPPIDSLIKGDWYLSQVEVIDGYSILEDSNRFTSQKSRNKKITFTSDSIYNYRDTSVRYYTRLEHYLYHIEYDSIMSGNYLKLFVGKKRKLREVESYEIIKYSSNELVIKSYQPINSGINQVSLSIVSIYTREASPTLSKELQEGE